MQLHRYFKPVIRKLQTALLIHKNKHLLRSTADVYGCKLHWTNSEDSSNAQAVAESCTTRHCQPWQWHHELLDTPSYFMCDFKDNPKLTKVLFCVIVCPTQEQD
jgi:hypothetical protein